MRSLSGWSANPRKDALAVNAGERDDAILEADNPGAWAVRGHDLHHVTNDGVCPGGMLLFVQYVP